MMNYLVSYPRSGNTWVRFILEWFSGRPSTGLSVTDNSIYKAGNSTPTMNKLIKEQLKHVKGKPIIQKAHWVNDIKNKNGKLILLIRNPLEVILRHTKNLNNKDINWFMDLIKLYDNWPDKNKIIIYYEDLMESPQEVIEKIIKFMDLDLDKLKEFMNSYNEFFNLSVNFYDGKGSGNTSQTKGKKLIYYSLELSEEKIKNFKTHLNNKHPKLITYLNKYDI